MRRSVITYRVSSVVAYREFLWQHDPTHLIKCIQRALQIDHIKQEFDNCSTEHSKIALFNKLIGTNIRAMLSDGKSTELKYLKMVILYLKKYNLFDGKKLYVDRIASKVIFLAVRKYKQAHGFK